jgi:hypothetical protein
VSKKRHQKQVKKPKKPPEPGKSPNWLLASGGEPVTAGELLKILQTVDPSLVMSVSVGPDYADIPLTDLVVWPQYGAAFLVGEPDPDKDEEEDVVVGEWVEVPPQEEDVDTDVAEPI